MKEKQIVQKAFGIHLKKVRQSKGISAAELARRIFVDKPHISVLEQGKGNPTLYTLYKIACALDLSIEQLFEGLNE